MAFASTHINCDRRQSGGDEDDYDILDHCESSVFGVFNVVVVFFVFGGKYDAEMQRSRGRGEHLPTIND